MRSKFKMGLMGALMMSAIVSAGCLRSTQVFTMYSDGSGKADINITLMGMAAQAIKMGQMGGEGGEAQNPVDMVKQSVQGDVYWVNVKMEDGEDGTVTLSGTGYFEDANKITLEKGSIAFEAAGDGYKATINQEADMPGGMPGGDGGEMTPEEEAQAEQMKAMMKGMLAGFEMRMHLVMPGAVTEIEGFQSHEDRRAQFDLDEAALVAMMDANTKPPSTMTATCGAPGDIQAEWDAFKVELAAAKAASEAEAAEAEEGAEEGAEEEGAEKTEGGDF